MKKQVLLALSLISQAALTYSSGCTNDSKSQTTPPPGWGSFIMGFYTSSDAYNSVLTIGQSRQFNIVHVTETLGNKFNGGHNADEIITLAEKMGLKVILEPDQNNIHDDVQSFVNKHNNIWGADIADDLNHAPATADHIAWSMDRLKANISAVQSVSLTLKTFAAVNDWDPSWGTPSFSPATDFAPLVDVAGPETYVYTIATELSPTDTINFVAKYVDAMNGAGRTPIMIGQAVVEIVSKSYTDPTAEQVRYQQWTALALGARGLVNYSFDEGDPNNALNVRNPEAWKEFQALASDMGPYGAIWGDSPYTRIQMTSQVVAGRWTSSGATYVVVTNGDKGQSDVSIDTGATGTATPLYTSGGRYSVSLSLSGSKLSGTLPAYGVAVYVIR